MKLRLLEGLLVTLCSVALAVLGQPSNGPIRLWRSGATSLSYTSGIVQLMYNSRWGNICDDSTSGMGSFGLSEASVVCHQLGYTGASDIYNNTSNNERMMFGVDTSPAVLSSVSCTNSTYLVILQCDFDTTPPSSCTNNDDVIVVCLSTRIWDNPFYAQVRLTEGSTVNQGLVEVYCSGRWGTICDDFFNQNAADTICRQLGYASAYRYDHLPYRGSFIQPILLDRLSCYSPQACLSHCTGCPSADDEDPCSHLEDVTIECYSPTRYTETHVGTCRNEISELVGIIIGGIIGGLILLAAIVALIVFLVFVIINCLC